MTPGDIAKKRQLAMESLAASSASLAASAGLDDPDMDPTIRFEAGDDGEAKPPVPIRDPALADAIRLERLAEFFALVAKELAPPEKKKKGAA